MLENVIGWLSWVVAGETAAIRREAAFVLLLYACGIWSLVMFFTKLLFRGFRMVTKSRRLSVCLPQAVDKQVKDFAQRLGTSDSKAALYLIMEGCKALKQGGNPFGPDSK